MATVSEIVIKVISENLQVRESLVIPEARLMKDLEADSLALVELAQSLEDAFGTLQIPDEVLYGIKTVQDIYDFLASCGIKDA